MRMDYTRAIFVTILYRMMNELPVNQFKYFNDIDNSAYYSEAVTWAYENEIIKGISSTELGPNINITREQLVTILYRYAAYMGYDVSMTTDISRYEDSHLVSDYATSAMKWAGVFSAIISYFGYILSIFELSDKM